MATGRAIFLRCAGLASRGNMQGAVVLPCNGERIIGAEKPL